MCNSCDILMITHNRADYTRQSLARLLQTTDEKTRVWLWHNGQDEATLEVVKSFVGHPQLYKFHHSRENKKLQEPTNWLWSNASGEYFSKVDDDCLMPDGWIQTLRQAHEDVPELGAISAWLFPAEDYAAEAAARKIQQISGGHRIMRNCWVGGSGYLMKRAVVRELGLLRPEDSFTTWCVRAAIRGWINGWYFPFLYMDHMDDPRSAHCRYRTEADFQRARSLSAIHHGINSLADFIVVSKREALYLQTASLDPRDHLGVRPWFRRKLMHLSHLRGRLGARWKRTLDHQGAHD